MPNFCSITTIYTLGYHEFPMIDFSYFIPQMHFYLKGICVKRKNHLNQIQRHSPIYPCLTMPNFCRTIFRQILHLILLSRNHTRMQWMITRSQQQSLLVWPPHHTTIYLYFCSIWWTTTTNTTPYKPVEKGFPKFIIQIKIQKTNISYLSKHRCQTAI